MEFGLTAEEQEFEREVDEFMGREVTPEVVREEVEHRGWGPHTWAFLRKLGERRWLVPEWPEEYGGMGASFMHRYIVMEKCSYYRAAPFQAGAGMVGAIILHYGSEEQKREFLPRIARGEIEFCLGYTEPNAGSDLASLEMRAVMEGEEYIINGLKTFSSRSHYAQYHWVLVRTDPNVSRHRGLSLFIVDMNSPGVTVRPVQGMAGFVTTDTYYDDVRVPAKNLIGEENGGWKQVLVALEHERVSLAMEGQVRMLDDLVQYCRQTKKDGMSLGKDPLLRQKIAQMAIEVTIYRLFGYRAARMLDRGETPKYEAAVLKLFATELIQRQANWGLQILGPYGPLKLGSPWVQLEGTIETEYENRVTDTIGGGSSEIMRNLIATRGLGLPR